MAANTVLVGPFPKAVIGIFFFFPDFGIGNASLFKKITKLLCTPCFVFAVLLAGLCWSLLDNTKTHHFCDFCFCDLFLMRHGKVMSQ